MEDEQYIKAFGMKDKRIHELSEKLRKSEVMAIDSFMRGFVAGCWSIGIIFCIVLYIKYNF